MIHLAIAYKYFEKDKVLTNQYDMFCGKITGRFSDIIRNIEAVKSFSAQTHEMKKLSYLQDKEVKSLKACYLSHIKSHYILYFITTVIIACLITWQILYYWSINSLSIANIIVILGLISTFTINTWYMSNVAMPS